jgi:hypothetical protein
VTEAQTSQLAPELAKALDSLSAAMVKANPAKPKPTETELLEKLFQFPLWPEPVRGMPNPALRSALFAAVQGKSRRFINDEPLATIGGIQLRFKGEQLNQEDAAVCTELFHLARLHPLGNTCQTSAHALLKALGRHTGYSEHLQLHKSIRRLQQPLEIKAGRHAYFGSLVMEGAKDEVTRHYLIKINPKLAALFDHGWTGLDREQRLRLRGKPLTLWLHAFYASHERPYPYKVGTLRDLAGSQTKDLKAFRQNLRKALAELQASGAISTWDIDRDDLVRVRKSYGHPTTPSRQKSHD